MLTFKDILNDLKYGPNPKQLEAIECLKNCVVGAGAGSGKTTVLSLRFLYIVVERLANVDEILTLTFTKKAASEMYGRIHKNLLSYIDKDEDGYLSKQLSLFPRATISTIDSFCAQIVRLDCLHYGLPLDFSMDDDITKRNSLHCIEDLIENGNMSEGFKYLSKAYSPDDLLDNLLLPIANSCLFLPLEFDYSVIDALQKRIEKDFELKTDSLFKILDNICDVSTKGLTKIQKELVKSFIKLAELLKNSGTTDFDAAEALNNFSCSIPRGKSENTQILAEYCKEFREIQEQVCSLYYLMNENHTFEITQALDTLREKIFYEKRKTGVLTFSDVANLSVDILKRNKEVRTYMKNKFRYIMIDEFQDNNELQKQLLFLLSEKYDECRDGIPSIDELEKEKLFFVGDEKQSIYRFRGADVSVFKQLSEEIEKSGGKRLSLDTNYRSEPDLIKYFNKIFPFIMENSGEEYEAKFEELGYRNPKDGIKPVIKALIKQYDKDETLEEGVEVGESYASEAVAVAKEIEKALTTDEYLISSSKGPVRPTVNDIAILMEKKTGQIYYEKALRAKDLPYVIVDNKSLTQEALTNDIYCILQLIVFPLDRISYAAVLRGPFSSLSDEAVLKILSYKGSELFPVLEDLHEDDRNKLNTLREIYQTLVEKSKNSLVSSLIEYLWFEAGLRYYYVCEDSYQSYLSNYDYLYRIARDNDNYSLSGFLDVLRPQLGLSCEFSDTTVLQEETKGIKIMTIHKSKGLEFPLVFICCMGSGPMNKPSSFTSYHNIPLTKNYKAGDSYKNYVQEQIKEREKKELLAEKKRVLYVAMTRAETHLVLVGTFNKLNRNSSNEVEKNNNLLLMSLYGSQVDKETLVSADTEEPKLSCNVVSLVPASDLFAPSNKNPIKKRKVYLDSESIYSNVSSVEYSKRKSSLAVTSLVSHKDDGNFYSPKYEKLSSFEIDDILESYSEQYPDIYTDFGTVAHSFVESALLNETYKDLDELLDENASFFNLKSEEQKLAINTLLKLTDNFMNSDFYKKEIENNRINCEYGFFAPYVHKGEKIVIEGFIDLLVENENGDFLIVDFKTDKIKNPSLHEKQITTYMDVVDSLYPGRKIKGCVSYLRESDIEYYY